MKYREEKRKAEQEGLRFCIICAKAKHPSEFFLSGKSYCRACHNQKSRNWALTNPVQMAAQRIRYRDKNPEAYAEIMRKAYLKRVANPVKYAKWKEQGKMSTRKQIEKIRSNPVLHEAYKIRQRELYHQRKAKNAQDKGSES